MKPKNLALTSGGALLGAALVMSLAIRAEDKPAVDVPERWQVAANTTADKQQPTISKDEMARRMEDKYSGTVTELELDREWGRDVYEIEVRTADGFEWDIEADANSGEVLEEKRERERYED